MKGKFILENGMTFEGRVFGHISDSVGEVVFTTSPMGYTEIISDPSFFNKIVIMTSPLVGNNGIILDDMESRKVWPMGLIIREVPSLSGSDSYDLFLEGILKEHSVVGMEGIDTRHLTKLVRRNPSMKAIITSNDLSQEEIEEKFQNASLHGSWQAVSCKKKYSVPSEKGVKRIGVLDFGVKKSFLASLLSLGCDLVVLPWDTSSDELLSLNLDALILSDGPEDPLGISEVVSRIKNFLGELPLLGVSLGYKLLSLALGGEVAHLTPSSRNVKIPVKDLDKNMIFTVSRNRTYMVSNLPQGCTSTHENLMDNNSEAFLDKNIKVMGVNFNPEGSPGPVEGSYVLQEFLNII